MDNLVYQLPHKVMQDIINYLGNNLTWTQAEPVLKLIRDNIKEIDLNNKEVICDTPEYIPPVEGK